MLSVLKETVKKYIQRERAMTLEKNRYKNTVMFKGQQNFRMWQILGAAAARIWPKKRFTNTKTGQSFNFYYCSASIDNQDQPIYILSIQNMQLIFNI